MYFYYVQSDARKLIAKKNIWNAILDLSDELMKTDGGLIVGDRVHEILNRHIEHGKLKTNKT